MIKSYYPHDPQRVQCPQVFQVSQARERVEPCEKLMETLKNVFAVLPCFTRPSPLNVFGDKEEEGGFVGGLHIFRIQQRTDAEAADFSHHECEICAAYIQFNLRLLPPPVLLLLLDGAGDHL